MPTMALTGEAFLLTIALAGSTSQAGRIVASALAMIVALAALHSLSARTDSQNSPMPRGCPNMREPTAPPKSTVSPGVIGVSQS